LVILDWPKLFCYCCWWEVCRMWRPFWVQFFLRHSSIYLLLIFLPWLTSNWPSLSMTRHYLVHMPKQMWLLIGFRQPWTQSKDIIPHGGRIKLNPSKTQAVFFTKRRTCELPTSDLSLDGYSIPWSGRVKYLRNYHFNHILIMSRIRFKSWPAFCTRLSTEVKSFSGSNTNRRLVFAENLLINEISRNIFWNLMVCSSCSKSKCKV
jgi:hypothetical protein